MQFLESSWYWRVQGREGQNSLTTLLCIFLSALFTNKLALFFCCNGLCWKLVAAAAVSENPEAPDLKVLLKAEENSLTVYVVEF